MSAHQFAATADASAKADEAGEDSAAVLADVPLPPRRPRDIDRTLTAHR